MKELYKQPLSKQRLDLFNINENSLIQTATLSAESHSRILDIVMLFEDILREIELDLSTTINMYHGKIIDDSNILSLVKLDHEIAKNAIIKIVHDLFNISTNEDLRRTLDYINNLPCSDIFSMDEYTYNDTVWELSNDILDKVSQYPYSTIIDIYISSYNNIENIPTSVTKEIRNIILKK